MVVTRLLAAALALWLSACSPSPDRPQFSNVDITGADYGKSLALTDHNGKPRTLADFRGKVVVLFFGYTQCPDVCPTTMSELAALMKTLGPDADRVQVLFVTVDPERDNATLLANYVPRFDPRFLGLYGDAEVLSEASRVLPPGPEIDAALTNLRWLASHLDGVKTSFDLADLRGYAYYSGARFSIYAQAASDALARGGRYDEVGAVFGRNRPAVGFSLDIKALVNAVSPRALHAAIRAPWGEAFDLREAIANLRAGGQTVVCVLPGHESELSEFQCDRELLQVAGQWVVQAI